MTGAGIIATSSNSYRSNNREECICIVNETDFISHQTPVQHAFNFVFLLLIIIFIGMLIYFFILMFIDVFKELANK